MLPSPLITLLLISLARHADAGVSTITTTADVGFSSAATSASTSPFAPTTCTGPATEPSFDWWLTKHRKDNPCQVLEALMQQCSADFVLPFMGDSASDEVDRCVARDNFELAPCCCSTEAYALTQACWSCQNNGTEYPLVDRPTLREFVQCPRNVDDWQEIYNEVDMPIWATYGIRLDETWSLDNTRKFTLFKTGQYVADLDDDDDNRKEYTVAGIIGGLCGLGIIGSLAAIAFIIYRRRHRSRGPTTSSRQSRMPAWLHGRSSLAYRSIDSDGRTYVEPKDGFPAPPRPTLGRGKVGGGPRDSSGKQYKSWTGANAKEPYLPRASNTLESRDFDRSTVSMIRSETESRRSFDSDESFSNSNYRARTIGSRATHAFSV